MRGGTRRTALAVLASAVPILLLLIAIIPATSAATPTLGPWTETTDYGASSGSSGTGGVTVQSESCVTYNGYVYCIAGAVGGPYSSKSFFAQAMSNGVGGWSETTDYGAASGTSGGGGLAVGGESCVEYGGDVYCVGGYYYNPSTQKSGSVSNVYFASLSASGIGAWTQTTDYGSASGSSGTGGVQVSYTSCVTSGAYIYCIGGKDANFNGMSKVFYAQMSSTGIGTWTEATDYGASSGSSGSGGLATNPTCVALGNNVVCIGGSTNSGSISKVFVAPLSSSGVGAWTENTDYGAATGSSGAGGVPVYGLSCAATNSTIYCVGGWDGPTNQVFQGNNPKGSGTNTYVVWIDEEDYKSYLYNHDCVVVKGSGVYSGISYLLCIGGNDPGVDLSAVWFATIQGPAATTTTTVATTPATTQPTTVSTTASTSQAQTTTSGGGGIPEFPAGASATAALTAVVVVSYLLVRARRQ